MVAERPGSCVRRHHLGDLASATETQAEVHRYLPTVVVDPSGTRHSTCRPLARRTGPAGSARPNTSSSWGIGGLESSPVHPGCNAVARASTVTAPPSKPLGCNSITTSSTPATSATNLASSARNSSCNCLTGRRRCSPQTTQMAFGVYEAARQHGLRVPSDLSIVGFDDLPEARWSSPPLTTVRQPLAEMGGSRRTDGPSTRPRRID